MKRINDRLTVYSCEEIRQIVSDLIGEDAYKDFDMHQYDQEKPLIIFAQYLPKENKLYAFYRIYSDYLNKKKVARYEFREIRISNGEWIGRSIHPNCFKQDDFSDKFLKECEKFLKYKGNEAFTYVSEFIINNECLTIPFIACNPDKFRANDLSITPQYIIDAREHLFDD